MINASGKLIIGRRMIASDTTVAKRNTEVLFLISESADSH